MQLTLHRRVNEEIDLLAARSALRRRGLPMISGRMPYYFTIVPTSDVTTSASANTLVDHLRVLAQNDITVTYLDLIGKDAAATNITGIELNLIRYTTPSTVGTIFTATAKDPNSPASGGSYYTGPTAGSTTKYAWGGGMLSAGQNALSPRDTPINDDGFFLVHGGGANGNIDLESQTEGTVAKNFKYTLGAIER